MKQISSRLLIISALLLTLTPALQAFADDPPKVLVVTAHPDDDAVFAATNYKIVHDLGGIVDLALVTNGEGGYKYSTLAESIYGLELTEEDTGRKYLPAIRQKELEEGGKIVGIRNYYYMNQKDHRYVTSEDIHEILDSNIWDLDYVRNYVKDLIEREKYDYVFVLSATPGTHAHHSSSSILALQAVEMLLAAERPVVLAGSSSRKSDTVKFVYKGFEGYPITNVSDSIPFVFDRTSKFGFRNALDYRIIVNWLIAEHKSQGTMQLLMNQGDYENYWYFDINDPSKKQKTSELFEKLKVNNFKVKEYK
jgi:LmbE family N-acetylglucosaminyl deacetylase